jgi:chromate transporter
VGWFGSLAVEAANDLGAALVDFVTFAVTGISLSLLVRYRLNTVWLILGGAVLGLLSPF